MTSSTSCSRTRAWLALAAALAAAPAAGADPGGRGLATRIALLPVSNLSGRPAPLREVQAALEAALRARGLELATGGAVDALLARHRFRYTGGVDEAMARAARDELAVDALAVTAVTTMGAPEGAPAFGLSMRLVSPGDRPEILWMDELARTADESPGLFDVGVLAGPGEVMEKVISRLADSLAAGLVGKAPAIGSCPRSGRFAPRRSYRAAPAPQPPPLTVAVVPFVNESNRLDAGEVLALEFTRELARHPELRVIEPGVVRAQLLRNRVVMEGGVSHETARIALGALEADLVVAGYARVHEDYAPPRLEFTVLALGTRDNRLLWESTSYNRGDDGVWVFDMGAVSTTQGLACRMVGSVVDGMIAAWAVRPRP